MGLSIHENKTSIPQELALLEQDLVMLDGKLVKPSDCYRLAGNPPRVMYNTNCPDYLKDRVDAILSKYHPQPSAINWFYEVEFDYNDIHYTGRLTPQFKNSGDEPSSWHVVLNEVFFGYLHKDNGHWEISTQRPAGLAEKVGQLIDDKDYAPRSV